MKQANRIDPSFPDRRRQPGRRAFVGACLAGALVSLAVGALAAARNAGSGEVTRIVFQSDRSGPYDLYTMNPDGSDVRRLTFSGARSTVGTKR